jgi:hypothetical protein
MFSLHLNPAVRSERLNRLFYAYIYRSIDGERVDNYGDSEALPWQVECVSYHCF